MILIGRINSKEVRYLANTGEFVILNTLSAAIVEAFEAGASQVEVSEALSTSGIDSASVEIQRLWELFTDGQVISRESPNEPEQYKFSVLPDELDCPYCLEINCGTVAVILRADALARIALFCYFERYFTTSMPDYPLPLSGTITFRQKDEDLFELCVFSEGRLVQRTHGTVTSCFVEASRSLSELACNYSKHLAVLHAATLIRGQQTVILVNPSGSGKTTLAWLMTKAGFEMVHDDCLPVNYTGNIAQMLTPSTLKPGSWKVLQDSGIQLQEDIFPRLQTFVRYHPISTCKEQLTGTNRHFLFVQFDPDINSRLTEIDALTAFTRVVSEECVVREQKADNLRRLFDWIVDSRSAELHYSDLNSAIEMIDTWLDNAKK